MKKVHKKLLAFCISVSLCVAVLSGCGAENTATDAEVQTTEEEQKVTKTDAIYIEPVANISDDFIRGMDASAVLVNENSGVKYYNYDGEEQDVFQTLAEAGVNYIRLRVWNDPYDENGNEINYGMSGENFLPSVLKLLEAGSRAVREIAEANKRDIQIVVHYTNIEDNGQIDGLVSNLEKSGLDYDILGLSYYPFWDGNNDNMQKVAKMIQEKYGKKVVIAETSYCYTSEDGDGCGNSLVGTDDLVDGYGATVQSQATMIRDICAAANEAGVLGVFYWEGTWIPVGEDTADNSPIWEKYGSGWASSFASDYDPEDAGLYYGGCSWDNQAMFDFDGYPLESLKVFQYLKTGSDAPLAIDYIPEIAVSFSIGDKVELPEMIDVVYNNRAENKQVADGTLTIGVRMKCNPKSWGTVDDFTLYKISD